MATAKITPNKVIKKVIPGEVVLTLTLPEAVFLSSLLNVVSDGDGYSDSIWESLSSMCSGIAGVPCLSDFCNNVKVPSNIKNRVEEAVDRWTHKDKCTE